MHVRQFQKSLPACLTLHCTYKDVSKTTLPLWFQHPLQQYYIHTANKTSPLSSLLRPSSLTDCINTSLFYFHFPPLLHHTFWKGFFHTKLSNLIKTYLCAKQKSKQATLVPPKVPSAGHTSSLLFIPSVTKRSRHLPKDTCLGSASPIRAVLQTGEKSSYEAMTVHCTCSSPSK